MGGGDASLSLGNESVGWVKWESSDQADRRPGRAPRANCASLALVHLPQIICSILNGSMGTTLSKLSGLPIGRNQSKGMGCVLVGREGRVLVGKVWRISVLTADQ